MASAPQTSTAFPAPPVPAGSGRLLSLDALRGFDMFWIIGGSGFTLGLTEMLGFGQPDWLRAQLEHVAWNGFAALDLVFPLFVFLVGAALPFSLSKRIERGDTKRQLYTKIIRRTVLLVLLGLLGNGLLRLDFSHLRYPSVLGRIGLAYGFAALITLHSSTRGRVAWIAVLLLGYWAAMLWVPVPGIGAGDLSPGKTLADYVDRTFLPGRLYQNVRDPEGILSTLPAIASVLMGVLAGQWLRRPDRTGHMKAAGLLLAGIGCLAVGGLWNGVFPINKNLWSSSFVLWAGGWSLLLLALFYLVIDVWGWKKWSIVFAVIGMNAITVYVGQQWINFDALGQLLFGRAPIHQAVATAATSGLVVKWLSLYVLYRQRIFLRL